MLWRELGDRGYTYMIYDDPAAARREIDRGLAQCSHDGFHIPQLLARVFEHDVLRCDHCGARRSVIAAITDAHVAAGILLHLGLPTDAPELAPARAPPQTELFSPDHPVA